MITILTGLPLLLALSMGFSALAEEHCERDLTEHPAIRIVERALDNQALDLPEIEALLHSESPRNPFQGKALTMPALQFRQGFERAITTINWKAFQDNLVTVIAQQRAKAAKRAESRDSTRTIFAPRVLLQLPADAGQLVEWKSLRTEPAFYFWRESQRDQILKYSVSDGFQTPALVHSFPEGVIPRHFLRIHSVLESATGIQLDGRASGKRFITTAMGRLNLEGDGHKDSQILTSKGDVYISIVQPGKTGSQIEVLKLNGDRSWKKVRSFELHHTASSAATLFEHAGETYAIYKSSKDKTLLECITNPAIPGRILPLRGEHWLQPNVTYFEDKVYLSSFYHDQNGQPITEIHDPFLAEETLVFESDQAEGANEIVRFFRSPLNGKITLAIVGYTSVKLFDFDSKVQVGTLHALEIRGGRIVVTEDQVYVAIVAGSQKFTIWKLFSPAIEN